MITDALFPFFARHAVDSPAAMRFALEKSFKFLLILVLPAILVVSLLAQPIVVLILGRPFGEAAPLLRLFSLLWGVTFFSVLCNKVLNAANHQTRATVAVAACLAVNVVLDLILIPRLGYMGAAIATLAAETVLLVLGGYFVARYVCPLPAARVTARPLGAIGAAIVVAYALSGQPALIVLAASVSAYVLILLLCRTFEEDELSVLKTLGQTARYRFGRTVRPRLSR
jgi:O-antigen/teichoic acid export membrane protein